MPGMSGPVRFGDYELLERIAEGGMSEVWRARTRGAAGFEKTVVVKRVLPALASRPGFVDLLIREAKIVSRLSHPNIAHIFDLGEVNGTYFLAMEYVHGKDLAHALAHRNAPELLPLSLRVWIAAEAARALDHAHRRKGEDGRPLQIVHRDVSPQNILLAYDGTVKVGDFGIARADEAGLGRGEDPTVLRGKYAYMSPEQAAGEALDRRSDIFALGVVLYEAVTGRRLFRGKSSQETLAMVREAALPDLVAEGVPKELVPTLQRALAKSRDDRTPWASVLHSELMGFLFARGEPIGDALLADAMETLFPEEETVVPNKLRVDLLRRAIDDATGLSADAGADTSEKAPADDRTQSLPTSRRPRTTTRQVSLLATAHQPAHEPMWVDALSDAGAHRLPPRDGAFLAIFGLEGDAEQGTIRAARAALDFQQRLRATGLRATSVALCVGRAETREGQLAQLDSELATRTIALLDDATGSLVLDDDAAASAVRSFIVEQRNEQGPRVVTGYRRRADRRLAEMRAEAAFVGRRAELRRLSSMIESAPQTSGQTVHITSAPGVGKTRLIEEVRACTAVKTWLVGRSTDGPRSDFALYADLVRDLCGIELDDTPEQRFSKTDRLRALGLSHHEVRTLGATLGLAYPVNDYPREGRARGIDIIVALRKVLHALAQEGSVVLVLEDIHFADDASMFHLPLLLRGLSVPGLSVITSRRSGALIPSCPGTFLSLSPLDQEGVASFLMQARRATSCASDASAWALAETGGVPEWLEMLVADAPPEAIQVRSGHLTLTPWEPPSRPLSQQRVSAWLDPLRHVERQLLMTASASPSPLEATTLIECAEGEAASVARTLHRLIARGWLTGTLESEVSDDRTVGAWGKTTEPAQTGTLIMRSRMHARVLQALLEPNERARIHQRILASLEMRPIESAAAAGRLAFHSERSIDGQRALEYTERAAAMALAASDFAQAADWQRRASDLQRAEGDHAGFLASRRAAIHSLIQVREAQRALALWSELAPMLEHDTVDTRATFAMLHAEVLLHAGRPRSAVEALDPVIDLALTTTKLRAELQVLHARTALRAGQPRDTEYALRLALQTADELHDVRLQGQALAALATLLARADRVAEADAVVASALALAARSGDVDVRTLALSSMGAVLEAAGDGAAAAERFDEALSLTAGDGALNARAELTTRSMLNWLRAGSDATAAKRADALEDLGRKQRCEALVHLALCTRAVISARTFPEAIGMAAFDRALESTTAEFAVERIFALELRAHVLAALGALEEAALIRDDAASGAEACRWASYTRQLREA